MIDLSVNVPPPLIDEGELDEASRRAARALRELPSGGLYHQNGTPAARATVAGWLERSGVAANGAEPVLCNGAQQAIHLSLAWLGCHSRSIASETETFSGAIKAAAHLGLGWEPVAHDEEGMLPDALDRVLATTACRIVFATPVCQNPLGFETGPARRQAIVEICRRHDAAIIEDDIYAIYAAKGRVTYRELAPERTWYLTSLSKCLTPLVRLGVLIPPPGREQDVLRAMRAESFGLPPAALALGCALIEMGADLNAAGRLRDEARARSLLARDILGLGQLVMPAGAPHLWLPMAVAEAQDYARRAAALGVLVTEPGSTSIAREPGASGIRLCPLAPAKRSDAEHALRLLAGLRTL